MTANIHAYIHVVKVHQNKYNLFLLDKKLLTEYLRGTE